ncbi:Metallo-dependent hydrolase [Hesseltinella vesiculosa]|uniref:Metallo-dependent hydrolase n=1 Tax=Hesseltinella vesiculosa TaxID=101127 RepID=A0A1X2G7D5_9FUNG|nr:Metallo-dependent hydrolase [Hesseltinella vesiculosa]
MLLTSLHEFCIQLPKVELHAHINGSLSPSTMHQLRTRKQDMNPDLASFKVPESLDHIKDFFDLFKFIYQLTDDEDSVAFATEQVMAEFAKDGVRYLELRTTPRANPAKGMTKTSYLQTVTATLKERCPQGMTVNLIISIDRRNTLEEAQQVVDLAVAFRDKGVVAIDLCGDCTKGDFDTLKPAFERARQLGFPLTLHFNEVPENIPEAPSLLSVYPSRLGHATLLDDSSRSIIYDRRIPVEVCMTSNVISKTVPSYEEHHLKTLLLEDHPFVICVR